MVREFIGLTPVGSATKARVGETSAAYVDPEDAPAEPAGDPATPEEPQAARRSQPAIDLAASRTSRRRHHFAAKVDGATLFFFLKTNGFVRSAPLWIAGGVRTHLPWSETHSF
jgi:hypothetical protein